MIKKLVIANITAFAIAGALSFATAGQAKADVKIFIGTPHIGFFVGKPDRCWKHRHYRGGHLHRHCGRHRVHKIAAKPKHCHWRGRGIHKVRFCHRH